MGGLKMPPVESAKTSRLVFENAKKGLNALKKPYKPTLEYLAVAELIGPGGDERLHLSIPTNGMVQYCPRRIIQIIHKLFQTLEGG
ncbi:hypothetical protein FOXYSP1_15951 [Fusarium oxysporum f. sp. phaseoli]